MKNMVVKRNRKNAGLTGIETAIILIAFVIVAAVFSFAVLNTGFQSTQKAQEVMKSGMEHAASALELDGGIIISSQGGVLKTMNFTVRLSPGKNPVSFDPAFLSVAVTTPTYSRPNVYRDYSTTDDGCYVSPSIGIRACAFKILDAGAPGFLEHGDRFLIVVRWNGTSVALGPNVPVVIEIKPSTGNVLTINRLLPLVLDGVQYLG
ncbi:archaellin/type IV pilin N-terminal domain-containing protein [Thermoflexus hugenholtzii]